MMTENDVKQIFSAHCEVIELACRPLSGQIKNISEKLVESLNSGGTLFWCGNGGSAADSQHLSAELVGRFVKTRRALRSISLTTDTSVLTCVANDFDYDNVFSRQIEALGRPGDVLIGMSTSGNSQNIVNALSTAKNMGLLTVALLGKSGGACKHLADKTLLISSESTARVQEAHIIIGHILCELIEKEIDLA